MAKCKGFFGPCDQEANQIRVSWRFGVSPEPTVVKVIIPLCKQCAYNYDSHEADGISEAMGS